MNKQNILKGKIMKIKLVLLAITACLLVGCGGGEKTAEIALNTIQCGMCVMKIEDGLSEVDGLVSIEIDEDKKVGKVVYNAGVVDLSAIEKAIAKIGYDANKTQADPAAYAKLDMCCKVPGKE